MAAWVGSTNLGDELVFAGLLHRLRELGVDPTVLSVDPAATARTHGVAAVPAGRPDAVLAALRGADGVVLGGGGLLQDVTSPWNLPYHLARVAGARLLDRPVAGVGLGAGPLGTRVGRGQVRAALRPAVALTVRDQASAALLSRLGLRPTVAADLALALPPAPAAPVDDVVVVCPRPWTAAPSRAARLLPTGARHRVTGLVSGLRGGPGGGVPPTDDARVGVAPGHLARSAAALADLSRRTGLPLRLVALQADRDGPLCDALAERLPGDVPTPSVVRPDLAGLPAAVGTGRVVVAVRFHAAVLALRAGRPVVGVGYDGKVVQLLQELGSGGRALRWRDGGLPPLADDVAALLAPGASEAVHAARVRLEVREQGNGAALEALLHACG